jgi:hypothetical protein
MSNKQHQIEAIANRMRKKAEIDYGGAVDVANCFFPFVRSSGWRFEEMASDDASRGTEAYSDSNLRTVVVDPSVLKRAGSGSVRDRFTLAEEMAHIECGHLGIRHRKAEYTAAERNHGEIWGDEVQAKMVAAAFLMPLDQIPKDMTAHQVSARFRVSLQAAEIRLKHLADAGFIPRPKRKVPPSVIDFLKEARARGVPVTTNVD